MFPIKEESAFDVGGDAKGLFVLSLNALSWLHSGWLVGKHES